MPDELPTEQPRRDSRCPSCGAEATDESLARHSLSAVGYLHDDQMFECSECGHTYAHGVPVGEPDVDADDLWCDVCNLGFMRVHRVEKQEGGVKLHLKCHHHHDFECPKCAQRIPTDGVLRRPDGALSCPACLRDLDRTDVPFCFYFRYAHRDEDDAGRSLVGFPSLTGATEPAEAAYGYEDGNPP